MFDNKKEDGRNPQKNDVTFSSCRIIDPREGGVSAQDPNRLRYALLRASVVDADRTPGDSDEEQKYSVRRAAGVARQKKERRIDEAHRQDVAPDERGKRRDHLYGSVKREERVEEERRPEHDHGHGREHLPRPKERQVVARIVIRHRDLPRTEHEAEQTPEPQLVTDLIEHVSISIRERHSPFICS